MKVVKRQNAVAQAAAAAEEANPTRRLEFEQQGAAGSSTAPAADVQEAVNTAFIAHIEQVGCGGRERAVVGSQLLQCSSSLHLAALLTYCCCLLQGLGEVVRRLEHKVDTVASLLDQVGAARCMCGLHAVWPGWRRCMKSQSCSCGGLGGSHSTCNVTLILAVLQNAFELLEARLASGVVGLEVRLQAVEQAQEAQQAAAPAAGGCCSRRHWPSLAGRHMLLA
jgi:hypothetical protein